MLHTRLITEELLSSWSMQKQSVAKGLVVELVYRLVCASIDHPKLRRFQQRDSIGQQGPDGHLITEYSYEQFVPEGESYWEISVATKAREKAEKDYNDLVRNVPEDTRKRSVFIFVTSSSGYRDWKYIHNDDGQIGWTESKRKLNDWKDVKVIDCTLLVDWCQKFPAVESWLCSEISPGSENIVTLEKLWLETSMTGAPPPLPPDLFLENRRDKLSSIEDLCNKKINQLEIKSRFSRQGLYFFAAYVASLKPERSAEIFGKSLVVSDQNAWRQAANLKDSHLLVVDLDSELHADRFRELLDISVKRNHSILHFGYPGGVPSLFSIEIANPKPHHIERVLVEAKYRGGRARAIAFKSDGNLSTALRLIQELSTQPLWREYSQASDLRIAELLGSWDSNNENDRAIAEEMSGKEYGEWIGRMNELLTVPDTPLAQHNGLWKVTSRYEAWTALGALVTYSDLEKFKTCAVKILREVDPMFELPAVDRFAAQLHGKVPSYSYLLRQGVTETLALLGAQPQALSSSCSPDRARGIASSAVRSILDQADWKLWGSLNNLLSLLAEAAPYSFMEAVENGLTQSPCPFEQLFEQEGTGIGGANYLTGLLWALESLAWSPEFLSRVLLILADLDSRDPGGNWANRPANSMKDILLPWHPQTTASIDARVNAVKAVLQENEDAGWKLLLSLLPTFHGMTTGTHKPRWLDVIPEDWSKTVYVDEYWGQVGAYSSLALECSKENLSRVLTLIDKYENLYMESQKKFVEYLRSGFAKTLSDEQRSCLAQAIIDVVSKHKKHPDAKWALPLDSVSNLESVLSHIQPAQAIYRHLYLFNKYDSSLYEDDDDFEVQSEKIAERRQNAVLEIITEAGLESVEWLIEQVKIPHFLGYALAHATNDEYIDYFFPKMLESADSNTLSFLNAYARVVYGLIRDSMFTKLRVETWDSHNKASLYVLLPFTKSIWSRANQDLADDKHLYWTRVYPNPYEAKTDVVEVLPYLLEFSRANSAIDCFYYMKMSKMEVRPSLVFSAFDVLAQSAEQLSRMDSHHVVELLQYLQARDDVDEMQLASLESLFLPLLDRIHGGAYPKTLERLLATNTAFFHDIISTMYKSKLEIDEEESETDVVLSEEERGRIRNIYRLLAGWQTPPGSTESGFDETLLQKWFDEVHKLAENTGHIEAAYNEIGKVLFYVPRATDGLWIHHAAAKLLNRKDADRMREGFRAEVFNSRGVYSDTGGKAERELAKKYRSQAQELDAHGYTRFASTMRQLADSYDHDAERAEAVNPFE